MTKKERTDANDEKLDHLYGLALDECIKWFENKASSDGNKAKEGAKIIGAVQRREATRANKAAIVVAMAKMAGLKGEALQETWQSLTGSDLKQLLPKSADGRASAQK